MLLGLWFDKSLGLRRVPVLGLRVEDCGGLALRLRWMNLLNGWRVRRVRLGPDLGAGLERGGNSL